MDRTHHWSRRAGAGAVLAMLLAAAPLVPSFAATPNIAAGPVRAIPGHLDPTALGCPGAVVVTKSTCLVFGSTSTASAENRVVHGNPGAGAPLTGGLDVACISETTCLIVGSSTSETGTLQWTTNGHVTKTVTLRGSSYLQGVECGVTTCLVVGDLYGVPTNSGTPTYAVEAFVTEAEGAPVAHKVPGVASLYDAACESSTSCFAVGSTTGTTTGVGVVVPITRGVLGARELAPGTDTLNHIACGAATACWMTGSSYSAKSGITTAIVELSHGHPGGRRGGPDFGSAIACVSATTCLFASATSQYGKGEVVELVNGKVVKTLVLPAFAYGPLSDVACPTATTCLATGPTGFHNPGANYFYTGGVVTLDII
jgi:hypothetical protein